LLFRSDSRLVRRAGFVQAWEKANNGGTCLRRWIVCAWLALASHAAPGLAAPGVEDAGNAAAVQTEGAAANKPVFASGLPLRRDIGSEGVGTGAATLAAAAVLLAGVWAAVRFRQRQRGTVRMAGAAALPWLGHLLPGASGRQLRVIETAALTSHARLHVVTWHGQEYLVSTALDKVCILDRREIPSGLPGGQAENGLEDAE
jgi:hypothetical protein